MNYVSDGLLNIYDAINNSDNSHNTNPPLWKDTFNSNDGVLYSDGNIGGWNVINWTEKTCVFNGRNYVEIKRNISRSFTIEVLFKTTQNTQGSGEYFWECSGLVCNEVPGHVYDFGIGINSNGVVSAGIGRKTSGSDYKLLSNSGLNDGKYHVASFTRDIDNRVIKLYIDGVLVSTESNTHNVSLTDGDNIYIGATCGNSNKLIGEISCVRIYEKVLSEKQIKDNYELDKRRYIFGKFNYFLIEDNANLKAIDNGNLVTIGTYPPSIDLFIEYGMDRGTINSILIDRNVFESAKPKILYYTNEENPTIPYLHESGTPYGQIIEQKESIDFNKSYINNLKNITITATKGNNSILKFIISKDDGATWLTFNGTDWVFIDKEKIDIIENGMNLDTINQLSEENLILISDTKKIKIAWYMKRASLEENVIVSHIKIDYNTSL